MENGKKEEIKIEQNCAVKGQKMIIVMHMFIAEIIPLSLYLSLSLRYYYEREIALTH